MNVYIYIYIHILHVSVYCFGSSRIRFVDPLKFEDSIQFYESAAQNGIKAPAHQCAGAAARLCASASHGSAQLWHVEMN